MLTEEFLAIENAIAQVLCLFIMLLIILITISTAIFNCMNWICNSNTLASKIIPFVGKSCISCFINFFGVNLSYIYLFLFTSFLQWVSVTNFNTSYCIRKNIYNRTDADMCSTNQYFQRESLEHGFIIWVNQKQ